MAIVEFYSTTKAKYDNIGIKNNDALYFLVRDDADTILWFNEHIVKEFKWQDEPKIKHDKVHLGGEVSIFYPDWAHELTLPNELDKDTLRSLVQAYIKSLEE